MATLTDAGIEGRIAWLGVVADREVSLCSDPVEAVEARFDGLAGECHGGLTRPSCSRVKEIYPSRSTEIRNTRQVSILSIEELAEIAEAMGIDRLRPEWTGANLVMEGVPALTRLPPASRLVFDGGAVVTVDVENGPCRFVGDEIEKHHPGRGRGFVKSAQGRRGMTGWVEHPGRLTQSERCRLFVPPMRFWPPDVAG